MPQIPIINVPEVAGGSVAGAYQQVQASPDAFGAAIGRANIRSGEQGLQTGDRLAATALSLQQLRNETEAKDADIKFMGTLNDIQFNPKTGYQTLQGRNAVDAYPGVQQTVQDAYKTARGAISNPAAQNMFDAVAVRRLGYSLESMSSHAAQQNKVWMQQTNVGRIESEINTGALYYNDDRRFKQSIGTIRDEAIQMAEMEGASPERTQQLITHYTSDAWEARISSVMAHDPDAARKMLDDNRDQIDAKHQSSLDVAITTKQTLLARRQDADAARSERLAEHQETLISQKAEDRTIKQIFSTDPTVSVQSIANDPQMKPETKLRMINVFNQANKPEPPAQVSHATLQGLFGRIHADDSDPTKMTSTAPLDEAYGNGTLTKADYDWGRKEFMDSRTEDGAKLGQRKTEFLSGMKSSITHSNPLLGQLLGPQDAQFYQFQFYVDHMVEQYRKDKKNPYDLFDPAKPDYLGKPEALAPYQTSLQEWLKNPGSMLGLPTTPVPPAAPAPAATAKPPLSSFFGGK